MNVGRRIVQEKQNDATRAEYGKLYLKFRVLSIQQALLANFVKAVPYIQQAVPSVEELKRELENGCRINED